MSATFGVGTLLITLGGVIADHDGLAFRYFYLWPVPMIVGSLPRAHVLTHLLAMAVGGAVVPLVQSQSSLTDQAGSWVAATASIAFAAAASQGVLGSVVSLEGRVGRAFSESPIGMALLSSDGVFLDVNDELTTMLRRDRNELIGMHVSQTTHPDHLQHLQDVVAKTYENAGSVSELEKRCITGDGSLLWSRLTITRLHDAIFAQAQDVTDERLLAHGPLHDELTGLPSRSLALDRLTTLLDDETGDVAVVVADIDGFGVINDSFGHDAGDHVLRHVAERLRTIEPSPHIVARLAGDEFVLLFRGIERPSSAQAAGEATRAALEAPLAGLAGSVRVTVGLCAGVAIARHRTAAPEALRNAQTALHRAKSAGPGTVRLFDRVMRDVATKRLSLEQELRDAIEQEHLSLDYQVGIDAATGVMVGAEALVRWEHLSGRRMPDEFIPLAEETGLIVPLGRSVMRSAVRQAATWRGSGDLPDRFRVSINVSARQVDDPDQLLFDLAQELGEHPFAAGGIAIELTETVVAENPRVPYLLEECRAIGVAVLLDDFGTGYSSFSALRSYPVDYIKIDRSFVGHVANGGRDTAMVRAMIEMANALGIGVIAEGVETRAQRDALVTLGCDVVQGHLIHRPSSRPAVTELLRGGHVLG